MRCYICNTLLTRVELDEDNQVLPCSDCNDEVEACLDMEDEELEELFEIED